MSVQLISGPGGGGAGYVCPTTLSRVAVQWPFSMTMEGRDGSETQKMEGKKKMDVFDGRPAVYCSCAFTLLCMDGCFCNVSESIMLFFVAYHAGVCVGGTAGPSRATGRRRREGWGGGACVCRGGVNNAMVRTYILYGPWRFCRGWVG